MTPIVEIATGAATAGDAVAARIAEVIRNKPGAVATGSSQQPVYAALARLVDAGLDATRVTWFALDEYLGLPPGHPQSYRSELDVS